MTTFAIRTLIVDDHAVVRSGYSNFLRQVSGFEVIAEAADADEAYAQYKRHQPDIVIMDIMLRGASGIEASRRILAADRAARILVFSMFASPLVLQQALDIGVLGVVSKDRSPDVLCEAAVAVASGKRYLDGELAQSLVFAQYDSTTKVFKDLSAREFEVFQMLVSGSPIEDISNALNLSPKTVANRLSMIRQKLGVSSDIQLVKLAASVGVVPWIRSAMPADSAPR